MNKDAYIIRRKIVKVKPAPVPDTTYKPEIVRPKSRAALIKAPPIFEELAVPKNTDFEDEPLDPIPQYQNPPPVYNPIDFRVNAAVLYRDIHLKRERETRQRLADENEPKQFLNWQSEMRQKDALERQEVIDKRHNELDNARKRAVKERKRLEQERLDVGQEMRVKFAQEMKGVQREQAAERARLQEMKESRHDGAPAAVARVKREKRAATKEMKSQISRDLKSARRQRDEEVQRIKENAEKVRYDAANHTNRHGDAFISKQEITKTRFLAELTDNEAQDLTTKHREQERIRIEEQMRAHRQEKEAKMNELYSILEELTEDRDRRDEEHKRQRKERDEQRAKEEREQQEHENEEILRLEKKQEKKRQARIREAEEMEESTRRIVAMNRYLALNKNALESRGFESRQDAALRSAKERQEEKIAEKQQPKQRPHTALVRLRSILGL